MREPCSLLLNFSPWRYKKDHLSLFLRERPKVRIMRDQKFVLPTKTTNVPIRHGDARFSFRWLFVCPPLWISLSPEHKDVSIYNKTCTSQQFLISLFCFRTKKYDFLINYDDWCYYLDYYVIVDFFYRPHYLRNL